MVSLLLTLLRVLFPLDPVARLREITRDYINWLVSCLEDEQKLEDLHTNPLARAGFAAHIIVAEHGVNLLIHDRARQLAGLPFLYRPRMQPPELRRVRPLVQIIDRLSRVAEAFQNLERLAARRAQRIKRELSDSPLRLAATLQSTSPMLRMVEDSVLLLEVLPRRRRGRWIARPCAQDGGGLFAFPRGPPAYSPLPTSAAPRLRTHPLDLTVTYMPACPMRMILLTTALAFAAC